MTYKTDRTNRRRFLAAGGGLLGAIGIAARAEAVPMTAGEQANVQVVNDFCAAWPSHDVNKVMAFFVDAVVYRMSETMEPARGRDAVMTRIKGIIDRVDRFDVLDTFARGPMVVNERIDRFSGFALKAWHGVGVFFIKDGKIVEWYDYTISSERA
jgi:limonene-1,2-epoxide hydrolase